MAILKQEQNKSQCFTWIEIDKNNSLMLITEKPIDEVEAQAIQQKYMEEHQYDNVAKINVDIYDKKEVLKEAIANLQKSDDKAWNEYLNSLPEEDFYLIKFYLSRLSSILTERGELKAKSDTISGLKTFFTNQPQKKLDKLLFGE